MSKEVFAGDEKVLKKNAQEHDAPAHDVPDRQETLPGGITLLQQQVGNRAVQRLLAQRGSQPAEVEDETANRIERERGAGQALDRTVQKQFGAAMGFDFSQVRVHASPEADALNRELGAEAFTTGTDIFFREGAYDPHSSGGQELLAHEMTHVVQQASAQPNGGLGSGSSKMTVNAPDDVYEQRADAVAQAVMSSSGGVQAEEIQMQASMEEEEQVQMRSLQRQEIPEEEELQTRHAQRQENLEEEEELQMRRVQRQEIPEEEELQARRLPGRASGKKRR